MAFTALSKKEKTKVLPREISSDLMVEDSNRSDLIKIEKIDENASDLMLDLMSKTEENLSSDLIEKLPIIDSVVDGFLIADSRSDEGKKVVLNSGTINGINFKELFCRAKAFSQGKFMPKGFNEKFYRFDKAEFEKTANKIEYKNLIIRSDNFVFYTDLIAAKNRSKAYLAMTKLFNNRCGVDENYLEIILPLWCENRGEQLSCALDLKELIETLSGVEAKVTKKEIKDEISKLKKEIETSREELIKNIEEKDLEKLKKEFRNRVKERPTIEEFDLRDLFVP